VATLRMKGSMHAVGTWCVAWLGLTIHRQLNNHVRLFLCFCCSWQGAAAAPVVPQAYWYTETGPSASTANANRTPLRGPKCHKPCSVWIRNERTSATGSDISIIFPVYMWEGAQVTHCKPFGSRAGYVGKAVTEATTSAAHMYRTQAATILEDRLS
jgi:hypothetical protein